MAGVLRGSRPFFEKGVNALKKCWLVLVLVLVVTAMLWPLAASANQPKTYFDYLERAWAVGEIRARSSLKFRGGLVLVFPGTIIDLTYGRLGKAHSIMLVDELISKDDTSPIPLQAPFYAPINVLPKYSYWRDNLPNTPHHEIPGGRRYLFVGDDIEPVKKITKAYTDTFAIDMPDRRVRQQGLLVTGLESPVLVIREDALRRLESLPIPASYYDDATQKALAAYAAGDAPEADRARAIGVIARAEMKMLIPDLEKLSTRNDVVGGAALIALDHLGEKISTDRLLKLADSDIFEIQVFAVSELGEIAGNDEKAFQKVVAVLESDESVELRSAAGASLGKSGSNEAVGAETLPAGAPPSDWPSW